MNRETKRLPVASVTAVRGGGKQSRSDLDTAAPSAARLIGSEIGQQVLRGALDAILGGKRR